MSAFTALAFDAVRDAARRRGLIAAAIASAIAGLAVQRCGRCEAAVSLQGETLSLQRSELGAIAAIASIALIAMWTYAIGALLASDGLATALEDGSAESALSRPISRDTLVLARLGGVWVGAFAIGAALIALAVGLAIGRPGVTIPPAFAATLAVAVGAWSTAAVAMVASLSLPRPATLLLLTVLGAAVAGSEVAALLGAPLSGLPGAVANWGPAWVAAPISALAPWLSESALPSPPPEPLARSITWAVLASAALVWRFRGLELPR